MKKFFSLHVALGCFILFAQSQQMPTSKCRTGENVVLSAGYAEQIQRFIAHNPRPVEGKSYTIPLVFHVFKNAAFKSTYYGFLQNVNINSIMPKILRQVNEDFNNQSAYSKYVPKVFSDVAGVSGFNFCLAQRTPTGEATTGIIYHPEIYDYVKNEQDPGIVYGSPLDPYVWDVEKYVNIFLIPMPAGPGFGHITYYNIDKAPDWAKVFDYPGCESKILMNCSSLDLDPSLYKNPEYFSPERMKEFQDKNFSVVRFLSSSITHELGHYFGLNHTFGHTLQCGDDDGFSDTPPQYSYTFNPADKIVTFPLFDQCNKDNGKSNGTMFYNFMDIYDFVSMFTNQQCAYMQNFIETKYPNLLKSDGCTLGSCVEDDFEPNESIDNATDLNFPASYLATLCKDDKDFYRITLPFKQSIKVKLLNLPEDYSLGLSYEKDGEFILDESDEDGKASEVLIANEVEGAVYIEVSSKKGGYHPLHDYLLAIESSLGTYDKQGNEITSLSNGTTKSSAINPNPSNGQINISFGENFKQGSIVKMTISDMYGNKKLEKQITITGDRLPVDVSNLKDDIYLVNLTGQNVNETHRLVIKK